MCQPFTQTHDIYTHTLEVLEPSNPRTLTTHHRTAHHRNDNNASLGAGAIIGMVIGVLVLVAVIAYIAPPSTLTKVL